MKSRKVTIGRGILTGFLFPVFIFFGLALCGCQPPKPEPVKTVIIPDGEIDPEIWGKAYPDEYNLWKKTEEPEPAGKSKYKRGFDADRPSTLIWPSFSAVGASVWNITSQGVTPTWCAINWLWIHRD